MGPLPQSLVIPRYALALGAVCATFGLRRLLDPVIGADTPFVHLFFLPVVVGALFGGIGPGLAAAGLAVVLGDKVSFDPQSDIPLPARVVRVATFLLEAMLISWLLVARWRGEHALRASEERYRTLAHNFPNGAVMMFDRDLRFLIVDGAGLADAGLQPDRMVGRTAHELFPAEIYDRVAPLYRAALAGEYQVAEVSYRDRQYVTHNLPVRNDRGEIVAGMVMTQEITERKRLEEQLRQAQKMDALGRLAGGVAHDFNNLLTIILGRCQRLLERLEPADPMAAEVLSVRQAGERAAALTRQLLAFSRKQVLETRVLDLNAVIVDMEQMLRRLIGERIQLITRLDPEARGVRADRGQLEQAVMNLCINARDAIPDRGQIIVETSDAQLPEGSPGIPPGRYVLLEVTDTGSGMDAATRQRIFEPFFTTKAAGKGSGLGLSIVHGIVAQNAGHISFTSAPGQGTVFRIHLPALAAAGRDTPPESPQVRLRSGIGGTILLVEDEDGVREMMRDCLSTAGYRVLAASHAEEALSMAERHPGGIDLLITDLVLPGVDGSELCRRLRATWPGTRAVFMSGYSEHLAGDAEVSAPGSAFLAKPFSLDALLERVAGLLDASPAGLVRVEGGPALAGPVPGPAAGPGAAG